jgi:hypothetical protein
MTAHLGRSAAWLGVLVAGSCQVSSDILHEKLYFCDGASPAETCGSNRDGEPMVCYTAQQIGGRDFCTDRCSEKEPDAERPGWRCADTRSRLRTCKPSDGERACPQPETQCLRTNLLEDEGVCVTMSTCSSNDDCLDQTRPACMAPMIRDFYPHAPGIKTDHSSCVQTGCVKFRTGCGRGESCLPLALPTSAADMDFCVPNCDRHLNCPPNYFCLRKVSGASEPAVCIPGILGFKCNSSMDCLLGECRESGSFKVCTSRCDSDEDCARYGSSRGPLVCVAPPDGDGRKFCQNPNAYNGKNCHLDTECRPNESCVRESPYYGSTMRSGECRQRCGPHEPCVNRGGVPHVCVQGAEGGWCYPGRIHIPCERKADCVGSLQCLEVASRNRQDGIDRRKRCTIACSTDADCQASTFTERVTYCNHGVCTPKLHGGMLCGDEHPCESTCSEVPGADGVKRCAS